MPACRMDGINYTLYIEKSGSAASAGHFILSWGRYFPGVAVHKGHKGPLWVVSAGGWDLTAVPLIAIA